MKTDNIQSAINWEERKKRSGRKFLTSIERFSLLLESPIDRFTRLQVLNPLYHTGPITVFLLLVILFTGIYLTMFYQFGFNVSYQAVANIEMNFIGRIIRAIHRYASGLAVITAVLHGWRTFFMDRFRGPRWLAWVSGMVMGVFVWGAGVTGYWLIFDERTQLFNLSLVNLIGSFNLGKHFLLNNLLMSTAQSGWVFVVIVITIHLGLSALIGVFLWYHVVRLNRPKYFPPRFWMWLLSGSLLIAAILYPAGLLPPLSSSAFPVFTSIDGFFLSYLPAVFSSYPWISVGIAAGVILIISALPWAVSSKKLKPIQLDPDLCTGCTLCASDCPYKAIEMVPRTDGKIHKYIAHIKPELCVSCGICIGSCSPLALSFAGGSTTGDHAKLENILSTFPEKNARVIFICERHALQNRLADGITVQQNDVIFPLTCIGMAHPDLAANAIKLGARETLFVGCPPEDCANREGNLWIEKRIQRERLPKLRRGYNENAFKKSWLSPLKLQSVISRPDLVNNETATAYEWNPQWADLRKFIPALVVLGIIIAFQLIITNLNYQPPFSQSGILEIALKHKPGYPISGISTGKVTFEEGNSPILLSVFIDGELVSEQVAHGGSGNDRQVALLENIPIRNGAHHVMVTLSEGQVNPLLTTLVDEWITIEPGQILKYHFFDQRIGPDPKMGKRLYNEASFGTNTGCRICHSLQEGVVLVGPSFAGLATRAANRVPGLTAEEYLRQSILQPDAYIVEGFPSGQMIPNLGELLTEEEIEDLVAFLLTLE